MKRRLLLMLATGLVALVVLGAAFGEELTEHAPAPEGTYPPAGPVDLRTGEWECLNKHGNWVRGYNPRSVKCRERVERVMPTPWPASNSETYSDPRATPTSTPPPQPTSWYKATRKPYYQWKPSSPSGGPLKCMAKNAPKPPTSGWDIADYASYNYWRWRCGSSEPPMLAPTPTPTRTPTPGAPAPTPRVHSRFLGDLTCNKSIFTPGASVTIDITTDQVRQCVIRDWEATGATIVSSSDGQAILQVDAMPPPVVTVKAKCHFPPPTSRVDTITARYPTSR